MVKCWLRGFAHLNTNMRFQKTEQVVRVDNLGWHYLSYILEMGFMDTLCALCVCGLTNEFFIDITTKFDSVTAKAAIRW